MTKEQWMQKDQEFIRVFGQIEDEEAKSKAEYIENA